MKSRRWVGGCLVWMMLLGLPAAHGTDERPAIGIGGNAPLAVGQPVQVLVSHASHPRLEDFAVSATYQPYGPWPRTEALGHPNDYGILSWKPSQGGSVLLKAVAPGTPPLEIRQLVTVSGNAGFPTWEHLFGLGLALLFIWLLRQRYQRSARTATS